MSTTTIKILSAVFFVAALGLAFWLVNLIKYDIDSEVRIKNAEDKVIEKLKLIREAELTYLEVNGQFTSDWDKLIAFVDTGTYYIVETREEIITLEYGADSSVFHRDTLDVVPARDRIFKQTSYINASNNGIFLNYDVSVGDVIKMGSKVYTLRLPELNKTNTFTSNVKGTVTELVNIPSGTEISKSTSLITLLDYKFNPNIDIHDLASIPGSDGKKFAVWANKIDKSGVTVDVIEVVDINPQNPARKESNEFNNQKPLRFGSRTEVTFAGNWE